MQSRRVVITGLGVVTPIGIGVDAFWNALLECRCGIGPVKGFDASGFACSIAGELAGFSAKKYLPAHYRKAIKVMEPGTQIAVAAADLAVRDSGLSACGADGAAQSPGTIDGRRLACNIGSGLICQDLNELGAAVQFAAGPDGRFDPRLWGSKGMGNLTPLWLLKYLPNMLSCHVSIIQGAKGPSNTITCGDASGHLAIGEAGRYIQRNWADAAIAGGAESKLNLMGFLRQSMLRRLAAGRPQEAACRPFEADSAGTVIGEGGGIVILEEAGHATARGAKVYAELAGHAGACDPAATDVLRPTAGGLAGAVQNALAAAGVTPRDVDLVVAHGTGVPGEDASEADEWRQALGERVKSVPAVAFTGATGSLFGGVGGVQVAAAAMAIHHGVVPPTPRFACRAAGCDLDLAPHARQAKIRCAVTAAFTVGGQSSACVLKEP
jgi:3-oxoacyl-[acyl-carrier-protein] synthase II